ncbi:glycosyltransferase family 2 protein [Chloroflexota bacterium]
MDKENPKVSVIICAYNMERLRHVHEAVESILGQTFKPYQIIVAVDHNEELFQKLMAELPSKVTVVLNKGDLGAVATDNVGIGYSTGDVIAFMDDDAVAGSEWLEHLAKHYQEHSTAAVGGRLVSIWDNGRPCWFPEELDWVVGGTYKGHPETQTQVRNLILCNMSVRKQVIQSTGFFTVDLGRSKNWGTGAESEFFLRLKHQWPDAIILYEPSAVVYHKVPPQRTSLKYVVLRSYNEGFHKARIERTCANLSESPISIEKSYLGYLVCTAIPRRLKRIYKKGSLSQVGAIIISIAATGAGYLAEKLKQITKITDGH